MRRRKAAHWESAAAPGYALALKLTIPLSLNLEINLAYQLVSPSPLVIPFAMLVNATDADGLDRAGELRRNLHHQGEPDHRSGHWPYRRSGGALGGAEATATVTVSAQGVPRSRSRPGEPASTR